MYYEHWTDKQKNIYVYQFHLYWCNLLNDIYAGLPSYQPLSQKNNCASLVVEILEREQVSWILILGLEPCSSDRKNFYAKAQSSQFIIFLFFTNFPAPYHLYRIFHYLFFFLFCHFLPCSIMLLIWDLSLNFLWIKKS